MGPKEDAKKFIDDTISKDKVVIFSKSYCPFCVKAKKIFDDMNCKYLAIEIEDRSDCSTLQDVLLEMTGERTVPRVFINGKSIGGCSQTTACKDSGELQKLLAQ